MKSKVGSCFKLRFVLFMQGVHWCRRTMRGRRWWILHWIGYLHYFRRSLAQLGSADHSPITGQRWNCLESIRLAVKLPVVFFINWLLSRVAMLHVWNFYIAFIFFIHFDQNFYIPCCTSFFFSFFIDCQITRFSNLCTYYDAVLSKFVTYLIALYDVLVMYLLSGSLLSCVIIRIILRYDLVYQYYCK